MNIKQRTEELYPQLVQIRRDLHRHPEPGFKEHWTSAHIRGLLDEWGIYYQFPVAGTGIVAMIQGGKPGSGNTVALRADMDALPLTEDSSRPCCSLNPGHMHACGHDAHVAIALGTARILMEARSEWSGCVKFFFQPAEETTGGALPMVEAGCMEHPHVDYVTGLHVMPTHETGEIEIRYGDLNASSDEIHIKVHGKSCHGAYPDTGVDAIVMAAAVINSLQTLVSRCISPLDNAVLTLGTIHGGTAGNIVAGEAEMTGTLRTTDPDVRRKIIDAMTRQVSCTCQAMGGSGEVVIVPGYAALINSDEIVDVLVEAATEVLGSEHIHPKKFPSLGVEDFSFFLEKAKGVFYHLGCANKEKGITSPLHSQDFDIDEACLKLGVELQAELALRLLKRSLT